MEKISAFLLAVVLFLSILSGCSTDKDKTDKEALFSTASYEEVLSDTDSDVKSDDENISSSQDENSTESVVISESHTDSIASSKTDINSKKADIASKSTAQSSPTSQGGSSSSKSSTSEQSKSVSKSTDKTSSQADTDKSTITVYMSVNCQKAIEKNNEIALAIAPDGVILNKKSFSLNKGASVYDLLKESDLIIGAKGTAMGYYVYSIQSLAEKACGAKSGWIYSVNGTVPSKSCSNYTLKDNDVVCWQYTCDNGNDL